MFSQTIYITKLCPFNVKIIALNLRYCEEKQIVYLHESIFTILLIIQKLCFPFQPIYQNIPILCTICTIKCCVRNDVWFGFDKKTIANTNNLTFS